MAEGLHIAVATPPGIGAVFTTRAGGVSSGPFASCNLGAATDDDDAAVRANRRALCSRLGIDPQPVVMATQVHGDTVRDVDDDAADGRFLDAMVGWPACDGLVTSRAGRALVVLAADCVPLLLWGADGVRVGAVHAGWRGLVAGVLARAADAMGGGGGVAGAIGPCAGPCCYRVDAALRGRFVAQFGADVSVDDRVDLAAAAVRALADAGVDPDGVHVDGSCTVCSPDRFFSHRRDGALSGRQAGIIWRLGGR